MKTEKELKEEIEEIEKDPKPHQSANWRLKYYPTRARLRTLQERNSEVKQVIEDKLGNTINSTINFKPIKSPLKFTEWINGYKKKLKKELLKELGLDAKSTKNETGGKK